MADMRATERLLEVIGERSDDDEIQAVVAELRRRGDTLVEARDLRAVLDSYAGEGSGELDAALVGSVGRLGVA